MIPREPMEVARLIGSGRWKLNHILAFRAEFGEAAFFNVLLHPFMHDCSLDKLTSYDCQQKAGSLLLEMIPDCTISLRDAISKSALIWNVSVEEWPFYLCRCFGIESVKMTVDEIASNALLNHTEKLALETFQFWLRGKPEKILGT